MVSLTCILKRFLSNINIQIKGFLRFNSNIHITDNFLTLHIIFNEPFWCLNKSSFLQFLGNEGMKDQNIKKQMKAEITSSCDDKWDDKWVNKDLWHTKFTIRIIKCPSFRGKMTPFISCLDTNNPSLDIISTLQR